MDELHKPFKENPAPLSQEDFALCREALDVLSRAVALNPQSLENLCKDKSWHTFIIDLVLLNQDTEIRLNASDQFLLIATRYSDCLYWEFLGLAKNDTRCALLLWSTILIV